MSPLLIKISKDFATLFTTINPIATLALFAGLTASLTPTGRRLNLNASNWLIEPIRFNSS
jgi:small neutral amino acid transporter SnatA (MarC family)